MSKVAREFYEKLKALSAGKDDILPVTVKQVDQASRTVDVEFDGMPIGDVRLQSITVPGQKGNVLFPSVGSMVLIERMGTGNEFFVTLFSELDEYIIEIDKTTVRANAKGVLIQRGEKNLKPVLNEFINNTQKLIDEINKIVVAIGNGPNIAALTQIRASLEQNKNDLNIILQ